MRFRYIAVEGPIGVGKTSLTGLLAERLGAQQVLEEVDNPFLREFYHDRDGAALQAQLYFLVARYRQQQELKQASLFKPITVSDYLFDKDKIFAYLNLTDSELKLYEKFYAILSEGLPQPDLVIYLQATTDVLVKRIARRRRDFEQEIARRYLEAVNEAYNYFFYHYARTPLLVVNTTEIDFVKRGQDLDELVKQVERMEGGTRHFVPAPSED